MIDVLFDDTKESIGSKLATADLIGSPYQVIIGPKGIKSDSFEMKTIKIINQVRKFVYKKNSFPIYSIITFRS